LESSFESFSRNSERRERKRKESRENENENIKENILSKEESSIPKGKPESKAKMEEKDSSKKKKKKKNKKKEIKESPSKFDDAFSKLYGLKHSNSIDNTNEELSHRIKEQEQIFQENEDDPAHRIYLTPNDWIIDDRRSSKTRKSTTQHQVPKKINSDISIEDDALLSIFK